MSVTPSEWRLLRALAWHRVMLVRDFASAARTLRLRNLLSMDRATTVPGKTIIRITDAGMVEAAKIEKELSDVDRK